jgi:Lipocalin-like domain
MSIALCVGAFVPVIYPGLGAALRPGLPLIIAVFLVNAFAQLDLSHAKRNVARPLRLLSATCWATLVIPILFWTILTMIGRDRLDPGLVLALSLQAGAAPIMATPAVALVLGMEVTFSVLLLLATMIIQPFTAPILVSWVAGTVVPIHSFVLGRNLFVMIGGSALLAAALRLWLGHARLEAYRHELAGINLLVFASFGLAMFDGVVLRIFAEPLLLLGLSAVAFIVALGSIGISMIVLRAMGADEAFIAGFASGHRNVGLMAAAQSGSFLPDLTWLYFALVQLPIYLTPQIIRTFVAERGPGFAEGYSEKRRTTFMATPEPNHSSSHDAKDLIGTWTLVSVVTERDGRTSDTYGSNAKGLLVFDANGRYSIIFIAADLPKFLSGNRSSGTADENKAVVAGSLAHFGTYVVDEADKSFTFRSTARHLQIGRARATSAPLSSLEMNCAL